MTFSMSWTVRPLEDQLKFFTNNGIACGSGNVGMEAPWASARHHCGLATVGNIDITGQFIFSDSRDIASTWTWAGI